MITERLKLMYITNDPKITEVALVSGVDIIFIDMEYMGKEVRQCGMDTVKNHHTVDDIKSIRVVIDNYGGKRDLLVRVNPIHNESEFEINAAIQNGADMVMLPMWKTVEEVERFVEFVNGRAKVVLLLETREAVEILDDVLNIGGIDFIYIGLNDLHLSYKMKFMFQPLSEGIVDLLASKIKAKNIQFGFGGIARLHDGVVPAEKVLGEHIRLGSSMVILSRSFCSLTSLDNIDELQSEFISEVAKLRNQEKILQNKSKEYLESNRIEIKTIVKEIVKGH